MLPPLAAALALYVGAAPTTTDLEEHARAARELETMSSGLPEHMPRLTDARVARVLSILADERRFLGAPFPPDRLDVPTEVCGRTTRAVGAYMMSGMGKLAGADAPTAARRIMAQMGRNTLAYQDELAMLMPFTIRCYGRMVRPLEEWLRVRGASGLADEQRKGLAQVRLGILEMYVSAIISVRDPGLKQTFRERLLRAAADAAPALASVLTLDGRRSVLHALRSVPFDGALRPYGAAIEKEMSKTDCQRACAF